MGSRQVCFETTSKRECSPGGGGGWGVCEVGLSTWHTIKAAGGATALALSHAQLRVCYVAV